MKNNKIEKFYKKQDWKSALALTTDFLFIFLLASIHTHYSSWLIYILVLFLIGFKQFSLGECLVHEACHGLLFSNKRINHFFGKLLSILFFIPYKTYCKDHALHHKYLLTDKDPTLKDFTVYKLDGFHKKISAWEGIKIWFVRPLLGFTFYYVYLNKDIHDREQLKNILIWTFILISFYFIGQLDFLFLYWLFPQFYVLSMCLYWSEIEDHFNVQSGPTRTNTSFWENLLLTHNNGFHEMHHKYPDIPWYHLKKAYYNNRHLLKGEVSRGIFETVKQTLKNKRG